VSGSAFVSWSYHPAAQSLDGVNGVLRLLYLAYAARRTLSVCGVELTPALLCLCTDVVSLWCSPGGVTVCVVRDAPLVRPGAPNPFADTPAGGILQHHRFEAADRAAALMILGVLAPANDGAAASFGAEAIAIGGNCATVFEAAIKPLCDEGALSVVALEGGRAVSQSDLARMLGRSVNGWFATIKGRGLVETVKSPKRLYRVEDVVIAFGAERQALVRSRSPSRARAGWAVASAGSNDPIIS
jgi:hypothetical protein